VNTPASTFERRRFNRCVYLILPESSCVLLALTGEIQMHRRLHGGLTGECIFYLHRNFQWGSGFGLRSTGVGWYWPASSRRIDRWVLCFNCPNPSLLECTGECNVQTAGSTGECASLLGWSELLSGECTGDRLRAFAGLTGECNLSLSCSF